MKKPPKTVRDTNEAISSTLQLTCLIDIHVDCDIDLLQGASGLKPLFMCIYKHELEVCVQAGVLMSPSD